MNLRFAVTTFMLLSATALIAYGLADYINLALGFPAGTHTLLNSFWSMEAIVTGISIILGFAYPHLRGVQKGDSLIAMVPSRQTVGPNQIELLSSIPVVALESGRTGSKIKVQVDGNRRGEGIITAYAGTITPAMLRITETER